MLIKILNREFYEEKITLGKPEFDNETYKAYQDFLLSIPEAEVVKIEIKHAYARIRLIGQKEQPTLLKEAGYNPTPQGKDNDAPRRSGGPTKMYKNWMAD